ncbi:unnamed protein product [Phyllotreta striolata]|uniref:Ankyrin repeat and zinc finger domain-containing protein 1 n=1 Tax=Phyllotreta striolata TaxID=444603 RepID=A0A9N9TRU2_PHYSR|nr:unnamed protein product [Phyllotreta striolata]
MENASVFSEKFDLLINGNVRIVQLEAGEKNEDESPSREGWIPPNPDKKSCSYCRVEFTDNQTQRDHYKLDWHRYNLKNSLLLKPPVTEEEFNEKSGNDDLSSISGSDSEKEDTLDTYATAQGKIFLKSESNKVFSLYKCLLFDKKQEVTEALLLERLKACSSSNNQWTILMLGGGHFAGAVFKDNQPILHKTFHCYTVRAGQGGSQSSRDSKSGGGQPKSAGASLRRYNEQALVQHVKSIVEAWRKEIEASSLIIYRASGPYNRSVLFGGSVPVLDKYNDKLRTIPFSTRRATFTEVKRVHQLLSSATIYESLECATSKFSQQVSPEAESKRNKVRASCINRAKSRETVERALPTEHLKDDSDLEFETDPNDKSELITEDLDVSLEDLQAFGDSLTPEQRKKAKRKKPKKSKAKKSREQEEAVRKELFDVIAGGNVEQLEKLLEDHRVGFVEDERDKASYDFINRVVDDESNTLMHVAAMREQVAMLGFLLEKGANPCMKNKNQQTAYTCTQSKDIREFLKQFAKENPDKHNYNKAQIPINALTNEEIAEKKKASRKIKKEKEKVKRKENDIKKKEDEEKERFLKLSDREKRALAAERRIISQSGKVTKRCFLCAADIGGKVPFEYMENLFCSIDCLKAHRLQRPVLL